MSVFYHPKYFSPWQTVNSKRSILLEDKYKEKINNIFYFRKRDQIRFTDILLTSNSWSQWNISYTKMMKWWFNWLLIFFFLRANFEAISIWHPAPVHLPSSSGKDIWKPSSMKARVVKIIISLKDVRSPKGKYLQGKSVFSLKFIGFICIFFSSYMSHPCPIPRGKKTDLFVFPPMNPSSGSWLKSMPI